MVASKGQIRHSNPKVAVGLGFAMIVGALWELVVYAPNTRVWKGLVPASDKELKQELTRSFLSYLTTELHGTPANEL